MKSDLSIIPTIFIGETLRSYAIRLHRLNVHACQTYTLNNVFNGYNSEISKPFPRCITYFIGVNDPLTSYDQIIKHTVLPLFQPFYSPKLYEYAKGYLKIGSLSGLSILLGNIPVKYFNNKHLAACPQCILEDESHNGTSYWHLNHQLTVIRCCPFHHVELLTECPNCEVPLLGSYEWQLPSLNCRHCGHKFPVIKWEKRSDKHKFLIRLAKFSDDALSEKIPYVTERKRWAIYEQQAEKMG
ncbi:MAG: TniQ family protein, partial [Mucilaginibacter sp.]